VKAHASKTEPNPKRSLFSLLAWGQGGRCMPSSTSPSVLQCARIHALSLSRLRRWHVSALAATSGLFGDRFVFPEPGHARGFPAAQRQWKLAQQRGQVTAATLPPRLLVVGRSMVWGHFSFLVPFRFIFFV
jgi:hypothetical protein